jgi:hypothetical protein
MVWKKFTDFSKVLAAFIVRAIRSCLTGYVAVINAIFLL